MRSDATSAEEYLSHLPSGRQSFVGAVRDLIIENLPEGYEESMTWGMLSYEVPLERYPETYNGKPLAYAALASQKNYVSLYLMGVYGDPQVEAWFKHLYEATGRRLNMGKSCVRFKQLDDVPFDVVAQVIGKWTVDEYLRRYERARGI